MYRLLLLCLCCSIATGGEPLPNTKPLEEKGDLARIMVDGIHTYLDRELTNAPKKRDELWKANRQEPIAAKRERLKKIIGVVDERVKPNLEYVSGPGKPSLIAEIEGCKIHAVRWAVLPGVDAEGFLIEPKDTPIAYVVAIPDAMQKPESLAGLEGEGGYALELARAGCLVLIPTLIDRNDTLSGNTRLKRTTNIPHREFLYRMSYEMGRTLIGYEVQKVSAAVEWFASIKTELKIGVIGNGEGGMMALYAGALDDRIHATSVYNHFAPHEDLHERPIDRNLWGMLNEFGDAEVATLIHPRKLMIDPGNTETRPPETWPKWSGPKVEEKKGQAAPGKLIDYDRGNANEVDELLRLDTYLGQHRRRVVRAKESSVRKPEEFIKTLVPNAKLPAKSAEGPVAKDYSAVSLARHKRQFDQLVAYTQKLWRDSDAVRKEYWKNADATSPEKWEASCETYRNYFHSEVIGKLPEPTKPLSPRTRQVYDEKLWTGHEVVLDVYDDVIAYGILLLPKDMKPGEKRPVVVCQHGLEGRPDSICNPNETKFYRSFGAKLADMGYIVYAPQNPYIFETHFRQIQRKANPLKLSLFSFIVRQHQRTLDWLETLPQVEKTKIGFYGLSYGGKTAMRVPAIEKRYCLSICSGDFNEWIGKNVSVELDRSYMWTYEYEMYEYDLGNKFNYAEMAHLITPRPFMVERGHNDGVGTDEMVAYEYAKVRYLYAQKLKIPERTTIDYQPGGHEIFLKGTKDFLMQHLGKPKKE